MASTNLAVTLAHAIDFLAGPLRRRCSTNAEYIGICALLNAHLSAFYAPTWASQRPLSGSTSRVLFFSPREQPPHPLDLVCEAAEIRWSPWMRALGGFEFDLFVDPGSVAIRRDTSTLTIWSDKVAAPPLPTPRTGLSSFSEAQNKPCAPKTVAQLLLEDDAEDDILDLVNVELMNEINWTPVFPEHRSSSPLSAVSSPYSRCSSRSSNSSSSVSESTSQSSAPSSVYSSPSSKQGSVSSRRERARHARVFIDTTKTDVTPYDGGKTTVLTGGVMLGGGANKATHKPKHSTSGNWRSARA